MAVETLMYDADGNRTDDRSKAIRGEVVERDEEGRIVRRYPDLGWEADERSLHGDAGAVATRPHASDET